MNKLCIYWFVQVYVVHAEHNDGWCWLFKSRLIIILFTHKGALIIYSFRNEVETCTSTKWFAAACAD